jgi:hypothetical protein
VDVNTGIPFVNVGTSVGAITTVCGNVRLTLLGAYSTRYAVNVDTNTIVPTWALELNGSLVPGSVFGINGTGASPTNEIFGQAIIGTTLTNSTLRLINAGTSTIYVATGATAVAVSASLEIERLS